MTCPEQIRCTELLSMGLMEVMRCLCTSVSTCFREHQRSIRIRIWLEVCVKTLMAIASKALNMKHRGGAVFPSYLTCPT